MSRRRCRPRRRAPRESRPNRDRRDQAAVRSAGDRAEPLRAEVAADGSFVSVARDAYVFPARSRSPPSRPQNRVVTNARSPASFKMPPSARRISCTSEPNRASPPVPIGIALFDGVRREPAQRDPLCRSRRVTGKERRSRIDQNDPLAVESIQPRTPASKATKRRCPGPLGQRRLDLTQRCSRRALGRRVS